MKLAELRDFSLQRNGATSLQQQLYQGVRQRILDGRYPGGTRLPAGRILARELNVSRNTVLLALAQLEVEGYIHSRRGSGNFVTDTIPDSFIRAGRQGPVFGTVAPDAGGGLKTNAFFTPGVPDLSAFPLAIWKRIVKQHTGRPALLGFDSDQGYLPLREAIAQYLQLSRACVCHAGQIIITAGSQQAISLAAQVLLKSGERVYVENPGYVRAREALLARGCRLQGITVDGQGIKPESLPAKPRARMFCLTPTHQYPLGGILTLERRMRILSWIKQHRIWLFEDDYDSEYHFYRKPVAAMQGLGLAEQVIYTGSFSKVIFPGLRLGYLVIPERLVEKFVLAKSHMSGETPLLEQAATADFINEGHFARHILRMRLLYKEKLEYLIAEASAIPGMSLMASGAGMHVVMQFDGDVDDRAFVAAMREKGVNARPLSAYYLGRARQTGLVLGFANASQREISGGVGVIKKLSARVLKQK